MLSEEDFLNRCNSQLSVGPLADPVLVRKVQMRRMRYEMAHPYLRHVIRNDDQDQLCSGTSPKEHTEVSSDAKPTDGKENFVLKEDMVSTDSPANLDGSNSRVDDKSEKGDRKSVV